MTVIRFLIEYQSIQSNSKILIEASVDGTRVIYKSWRVRLIVYNRRLWKDSQGKHIYICAMKYVLFRYTIKIWLCNLPAWYWPPQFEHSVQNPSPIWHCLIIHHSPITIRGKNTWLFRFDHFIIASTVSDEFSLSSQTLVRFKNPFTGFWMRHRPCFGGPRQWCQSDWRSRRREVEEGIGRRFELH